MTRDYSSCLDFESLKKAARNAVKRSADYDEMKKIRKQACMLVEDGTFDDSGYSSRMVNDSDMAPGDDYLMDIGVVDVDDYD